jgi:hypothetical protein
VFATIGSVAVFTLVERDLGVWWKASARPAPGRRPCRSRR